MRKALLVLNPIHWAKRTSERFPAIVNRLEEAGIRVEVTLTRLTAGLMRSVEKAVLEGYSLVIAGGGDGTVSEVAAGLVGSKVPLGVLPIGTFNNIAHSLCLPFDLAEATATIVAGKTIDIDVCEVNGTYCFEAVGVGLDASLFPIGEEIKGGHYEKILEGAAKFLWHRKADLTLILDGNEVNLRSPMVVVANGPYYGAGFTVAPGASLTDGMLDVVTFDCSKVEIARHFTLSSRNRPHQELCIATQRAKEVTIIPRLPLPAHADGKPLSGTPVTCRIIPKALRVIVPAVPCARRDLFSDEEATLGDQVS